MKNYAIEKKIDELLSVMTLKEKIGQLNQVMPPEKDDEDFLQAIKNGEIGSIILASSSVAGNGEKKLSNIDKLIKYQKTAVEESRLKIPVIYGRDVIHGHNTVLPIPLAMAAAFDAQQVKDCYRFVAKEAARDGVHWTFSPMLDISRDPRWGRIIESPGEDPLVGERVAKAVVEGFQGDDLTKEGNIAACAKHYIGYGASEGGRDYSKTEISDYNLRNYYLKAFKSAVDSGVQTVMSAFNEISGQPISSSRYLLTELLKDELGFDGFVVSDWGAVEQLVRQGVATDKKECAELSVNAGIDMDMVDHCYTDYLEKSVEEGKVDMAQIDDAVRRVLRVKFNTGLFDNPYPPEYEIDFEANRQKERALAADTMVLLKNNGVLPLRKEKKVALIGPMATEQKSMLGSWTLDGLPGEVVTIVEGMKEKAGDNVRFYVPTLFDEQFIALLHSDIAVLCLGESCRVTGENNCLAHIEVPDWQVALAKKAKKSGKPVVALMSFGRPVALEEIEPFCDAILYTWHPGTMAGAAIADILYADTVPSGRLPVTIPRCTGQIPIYYNAPSSGRYANGYYGEGLNYHDCSGRPMYPFGYGLSYTEFKYGKVSFDTDALSMSQLEGGEKFRISVDVENVGGYDGKEVVQLYIHDKVASMTRPVRELKAFEKVLIEKGKTRSVTFEIGLNELSFYNADKKFTAEKGEFEIFVGKNSYAPLAGTIKIV